MKVLYIETRTKTKPEDYFIDENLITRLPKKIFLAYSIQFKGQAETMKKALEKHGINVMGFQQVLGCTRLKTPYTILLIGQGSFHALNLAVQNPEHPLIIYSNGSSLAITRKQTDELQKKKQAALSLFLMSDRIGILVSLKPGQEKLGEAESLVKKIEKKYPEKKVYIFISDSINPNEFQNFNIQSWINTACPGLSQDSGKIANIDDVSEILGY